ncbi:MAG: bifunctional DNA-formamidopyrimidine glycosylase/DNA-(apurinic or apyrimidinic site) lyase [Alphaproteobacteria bacterium]|nr:bifunctional DNA-formamidopyrimidine glycosylase/DNA-(apurinic or apyrimidinic site) lyase [Alphaproteobacteria bacterium]
MPELPEVETTRRGLARVLEGARIARVEVRRRDLRWPLPPDLERHLEGRRVDRLNRRAKYLLAHLDDGGVWLIHLGMSGRLIVEPAGQNAASRRGENHVHVVVTTAAGDTVLYQDARRFGSMDWVADAAALAAHPRLKTLGLEPLSDALDGGALQRLFAGRRTPLKAALLDQRLVAGLGNIYVCEALYRAHLSPFRAAGGLTDGEAAALAREIRATLEEAVAAGGSSLRDYVQTDGELGYFQHSWRVYGREGQPCPCREGAVIARHVQGGRSTFYCPSCQV